MRLFAGLRIVCLAVWAGAVAGCSGPQLDELVDQSVQKVSQGVESVKSNVQQAGEKVQEQVEQKVGQGLQQARDQVASQAGQAGKIRLELDPVVEVNSCFATLIGFRDGRPSVLLLQSYRDVEQESFPSVLLRATVPSVVPAELAGQTIEAELFVQVADAGPIWSSDGPVSLQIVSADAEKVSARILGGTLRRADTLESRSITGEVEGRSTP